VKFDLKTSTKHDVDVSILGNHSLGRQGGGLAGSLEGKYKLPQYGAVFTEKWSSASVYTSEISVEDKLVKGLKTGVDISVEPNTGKFGAGFNAGFRRPNMNLKVDVGRLTSQPLISSSIVLGLQKPSGFLGGAQASFDTATNTISAWQCALGYDMGDFVMHGAVRNLAEYTASVYQTVNPRVETALSVTYLHPAHVSTFALASKFNFDTKSWVKAKVDSASVVTVSYGFSLNDGVKLILGGQVDGKNVKSGGHRVGLALEFDA